MTDKRDRKRREVDPAIARTELGAILVAAANEEDGIAGLATVLDLEERTLRRIIGGECEPTASVILRIADYLLPDTPRNVHIVGGWHRIILCVR